MNERASWDNPRWSLRSGVTRLFIPQAPSGLAASESRNNADRLTACLVRRPSSPAGLVTSQALQGEGNNSIIPGTTGLTSIVWFFQHRRADIPPSLERDGPLSANLWSHHD